MATNDILQLGVSLIAPFVAAGGALWIYSLQQRERVSCFITYGFGGREYEELSFLGIHNRSNQAIAVIAVRYRCGIVRRKACQGTALSYEDPSDLGFPYVVSPGEIRKLWLDEHHTIRAVIIRNWPSMALLHVVFHRLNSGSLKLSPQELRQALLPGEFTKFAVQLCVGICAAPSTAEAQGGAIACSNASLRCARQRPCCRIT